MLVTLGAKGLTGYLLTLQGGGKIVKVKEAIWWRGNPQHRIGNTSNSGKSALSCCRQTLPFT